MFKTFVVFAITIPFFLGSQVYADPPSGKGKGHPTPASQLHASSANSAKAVGNPPNDQSLDATIDLVTAGITAAAARSLAVNIGYVGLKPLPPGIVKNLARGKPLPPGIATRYLPNDLLRRLPYYDGYQWLSAGTDLLLINTASRVIADVLKDALR